MPSRGLDIPNFFEVVANLPSIMRSLLSGPKVKIDEEVDFEEMFDAEGNVHLMPKVRAVSIDQQQNSARTSDRK